MVRLGMPVMVPSIRVCAGFTAPVQTSPEFGPSGNLRLIWPLMSMVPCIVYLTRMPTADGTHDSSTTKSAGPLNEPPDWVRVTSMLLWMVHPPDKRISPAFDPVPTHRPEMSGMVRSVVVVVVAVLPPPPPPPPPPPAAAAMPPPTATAPSTTQSVLLLPPFRGGGVAAARGAAGEGVGAGAG